jgi:hypothetical protein
MTEPQILEALKQSSIVLKQHQTNHKTLRSNYLEELADTIVLSTSPNLASDSLEHIRTTQQRKQLKKLLERENSRRLYRKLGGILHSRQSRGLSQVDIPDREAGSDSTGDPADPKTWT